MSTSERPREKQGHHNVWLTPEWFLNDGPRAYWDRPIPLDPCTESDNPTKAVEFFTEKDDGLARVWHAPSFINPPYSKTREDETIPPMRLWAAKIGEEARRGQEIIALLPCGARFSTKYWQANILIERMHAVCFVNRRIQFVDGRTGTTRSGQNNYDSAVYGFNVDPERFCKVFSSMGATFATRHAQVPAVDRLGNLARGTDVDRAG